MFVIRTTARKFSTNRTSYLHVTTYGDIFRGIISRFLRIEVTFGGTELEDGVK